MIEVLKRLPAGRVQEIAPPHWFRRPFNLVWEQTILPFYAVRSEMLWSPSSTGPLFLERQVLTVHDLAPVQFRQDFNPLFGRYFDFVFPRLLPRIAGIITASEYTRRRVLETYRVSPGKVHAIPLGVDHARFRPQARDRIDAVRSRLKLPARYILFLGTVSVRKNVGQLVRAWAHIHRKIDSDVHLVIAGGSGAAHVFNEPSLPELPPRTHVTGRIDEDDLAPLLGGAEVFVFPSQYEGFALPPLEAMACGTPCITSNVTSLPELIGDAGLLVSPYDDRAMADALEALLT
ncbi:MAG TPA: glycosyltransferase family 1 protein, partial [Candidatus Acidoferrales bacterium]|nr:glycosyltransferase family 1 protein [Candidatus Acidoferrales bacterium]